jgi:phosphoribosylaminoimidazole-succinocarboxamide synthase
MDHSRLTSLAQIGEGKAHDIYAIDEDTLLIVSTDRLSLFDTNMGCVVPHKGAVMDSLSKWWFARTAQIIDNHLAPIDGLGTLLLPDELERVRGRAMAVRRLVPIRIEAVVRGYLVGNLHKEYVAAAATTAAAAATATPTATQLVTRINADALKRPGCSGNGKPGSANNQTVHVWGHALPVGMRYGQKLPTPLFTPSTKADRGSPDVYLDRQQARDHIERTGGDGGLIDAIQEATLKIYALISGQCEQRGVIMADTKMEFGTDPKTGELVLMDELGTPDCSRLWHASHYEAWYNAGPAPGTFPPALDKQHIKAYLESIGWQRGKPVPPIPNAIIDKTTANYQQAERLLCSAR